MDLTPTVSIPAEPSGMTLFVTGLLSIAAYLALTGQWHLLRPKASVAEGRLAAPAPSRLGLIRPAKSKYELCRYDSHFAHSLAKIMEVAKQLDKNAVIQFPTELFAAQMVTSID